MPSLQLLLLLSCLAAASRAADAPTEAALRKASQGLATRDYYALKGRMLQDLTHAQPGRFGLFVPAVRAGLDPEKKVLALTFDACGGKHLGFNAKLIEFLRKEKIPATLFVTGVWIDANPGAFRSLAADPLFEIENHGLLHRLCSVTGESRFGVDATGSLSEVIDEIELNARKIASITGRRPVFFRPATAYADGLSVRVAERLGMKVVSYDVVSGDAVPFAPAKLLADTLVRGAKNALIVIMHFNHPDWQEEEALRQAVPRLRAKGFSFVKLRDCRVPGRGSVEGR